MAQTSGMNWTKIIDYTAVTSNYKLCGSVDIMEFSSPVPDGQYNFILKVNLHICPHDDDPDIITPFLKLPSVLYGSRTCAKYLEIPVPVKVKISGLLLICNTVFYLLFWLIVP